LPTIFSLKGMLIEREQREVFVKDVVIVGINAKKIRETSKDEEEE